MADKNTVKDNPFSIRNINEGLVKVEIKERLKRRIISTVDLKVREEVIDETLDIILCGINMMNDRDEEGVSIPSWDYRNYSCIEVPSSLSDLVIPNRVLFDTACPSLRHNLRRRVHYDSDRDEVDYDEYHEAVSKFGIIAKDFNISTVSLESLNTTIEVHSIYNRAVCNDRIIAAALSNGCVSGVRFPIWIDDIFGYAVSRDFERALPYNKMIEEWVRHFKISGANSACTKNNENN